MYPIITKLFSIDRTMCSALLGTQKKISIELRSKYSIKRKVLTGIISTNDLVKSSKICKCKHLLKKTSKQRFLFFDFFFFLSHMQKNARTHNIIHTYTVYRMLRFSIQNMISLSRTKIYWVNREEQKSNVVEKIE